MPELDAAHIGAAAAIVIIEVVVRKKEFIILLRMYNPLYWL